MAVNSTPLFTPGQAIKAEELQRWLTSAGLGTMDATAATESMPAGDYARTQWQAPGRFGPTFARVPWGEQTLAHDGGVTSDGTTRDLIYQPRNRSTFGNSDTTDIWDAQTGEYLMATQQGTALRDLANFAAMSAGGYYGANALNGAMAGAGGAATGGAEMAGLDAAMVDLANAGGITAGDLAGTTAATGAATGGGSAGLSSADKAAMFGPEGYGPGMTGAQTSTFDTVSGLTGSNQAAAGASDLAGLINGGSMNLTDLAKLAGAIYGAQQSKDRTQTTTQTHDPWAPAQPYLLAQLGNVAKLQQHYQDNPVNDLQKDAANQKIGLLSALNSQVLPGLLSGMGTLSAGYQRPGGPAPRPSGMNYDPSALLAGMQGNNIDWSRMFPPKG